MVSSGRRWQPIRRPDRPANPTGLERPDARAGFLE
jgi:hypothetical protein